MKQIEIEFFFPLTEQISLDLDFSECSPHQYYIRAKGIAGSHGPYPTGIVYAESPITSMSSGLTINTTQLTINGIRMPWYRKGLFKLLGFNYK